MGRNLETLPHRHRTNQFEDHGRKQPEIEVKPQSTHPLAPHLSHLRLQTMNCASQNIRKKSQGYRNEEVEYYKSPLSANLLWISKKDGEEGPSTQQRSVIFLPQLHDDDVR
jgi:hypothetical protein